MLVVGLLPTICAQETPANKYRRLVWEADSTETLFYLQFWQAYDRLEYEGTMDSKAFVVAFSEWMMKIIERNNYVLENYEQIVLGVSWVEGVHILRTRELLRDENQRLSENLRELLYH